MNCSQPKLLSQHGNWEFDLSSKNLTWDANQYKIYGYHPEEFPINGNYFLVNTTHSSDLKRISKIIDDAVKHCNSYQFKRRIIKKDGTTGFAETQATIVRSASGSPEKIIGKTIDLEMEILLPSDYNDPKFFNFLYTNYKKTVSLEIFKMVYDNAVTKDLCQEVFLKAWTNMGSYDPAKGKMYTWLINITKNHCKDYLRSRGFRDHKNTGCLDFLGKSIGAVEVADNRFVKDLLSQLPSSQNEIMELLFVQGFSQSEVAKIKGIPLGTVKTKSRESVKFLRMIVANSEKYDA